MSKAVELLEKNVQYITLGLGGAFVLFMGYRYLYQSPTRELDGTTLSAGQIDPHVASRLVPELEGKMNSSGKPEIPLPTFDGAFRQAFAGPTTRPLSPGWTLSRGLTIDLPSAGGTPGLPPLAPGSPGTPAAPSGAIVVKAAPVLPAAIPIGTSSGLSTVNLTSLVSAAMAGQGMAGVPGAFPGAQPGLGMGMSPEGSAGPGDPTAPAPGGARTPAARVPRGQQAPAAPINPNQADRAWVTAAFEIPVDQIAQSFIEADVPAGLMTTFLRVEVQREELQRDGSWGSPTTVKPLLGSPLAMNPLPPAPNPNLENAYRIWAEANQTEILQPGFFSVIGGALWSMPGQAGGVVEGIAFDASKYLTGPIPAELTKEERDAVLRARAAENSKKAAEERQKRIELNRSRATPPGGGPGYPGGPGGPPGGGRGGGGGGRGGGGFMAPIPPKFSFATPPGADAPGGLILPAAASASGEIVPVIGGALPPMGDWLNVPAGENQWRLTVQTGGYGPPGGGMGPPTQRPPGYPPNLPWPPSGMSLPPGMGRPGGPNPNDARPPEAAPAPEQPVGPNFGTLPQGQFDPAAWQGGNIISFQHDDAVTPGKSYRYRMRYLILNPVYGQLAAAAEPKIAQQFKWESAWSDWTDTVNVSSKLNFFVANQITTGATSVSVEVFQFVKGKMTSKTFTVQPGDVIGGTDSALAEFNTGYTLVDIRRDPTKNENYALILAPDGSLIRRDGSDKSSQRYQDLRKQISAPAPVGAAGN